MILVSTRPVCYSRGLPARLKEHPRNKSAEELRFIADRGGFIGMTMFPPFLRWGIHANVMDYVEAIDDTINLVGEDCGGIDTDFTQGSDCQLVRDGWQFQRGSQPGKLYAPNHATCLSVPSTPSDRRAFLNFRQDVRGAQLLV